MIKFTRGDTLLFTTLLTTSDRKPITIDDIDTLFITCKKLPKDNEPIIFQKKLDDVTIDSEGYCHVKFEPKDTEKLLYRSYFFDIEVTLKSGYRKTKLDSFILTEETTTHGGESDGN